MSVKNRNDRRHRASKKRDAQFLVGVGRGLRETFGVLKIEEHSLSDSARRAEGGGGSTSQATTGRAC